MALPILLALFGAAGGLLAVQMQSKRNVKKSPAITGDFGLNLPPVSSGNKSVDDAPTEQIDSTKREHANHVERSLLRAKNDTDISPVTLTGQTGDRIPRQRRSKRK